GVDLYASMEAAKEVGGDFYNFYVLDEDRVVITIADVSGKGIPAALFMLVSMGLLWSFVPDSPGAFTKALDAANLWLCNHNDGMMFVTVFTGILNRRTGKFTYVNAGHNSPLMSRRELSNFEYLPMAQNGFLGINDKAVFREETITLNHGDWLFLYTDGLTEAENGEHDFFGDDRLLDTLNEFNNSSAKELISHVHERVKDFVGTAPQSDDLTMLALRYL
ncbi:MAG: PP2C family protein-serine/threonine phosphatase, partial [Synergistaceae bacterium]|nr:PP2C family protein-serine/threonine phosphatase [Synergistaceae bacterium]